MPWFRNGDTVWVILELEAVEDLEPSARSASVLILGRTCCALFTGIFAIREQSHDSITDNRGGNLEIWRKLVRDRLRKEVGEN